MLERRIKSIFIEIKFYFIPSIKPAFSAAKTTLLSMNPKGGRNEMRKSWIVISERTSASREKTEDQAHYL